MFPDPSRSFGGGFLLCSNTLDNAGALTHIDSMNKLTMNRRAAVVRGMVEGNSIRFLTRMTGVSKGAVLRMLAEVGEFCAIYQAARILSSWFLGLSDAGITRTRRATWRMLPLGLRIGCS